MYSHLVKHIDQVSFIYGDDDHDDDAITVQVVRCSLKFGQSKIVLLESRFIC